MNSQKRLIIIVPLISVTFLGELVVIFRNLDLTSVYGISGYLLTISIFLMHFLMSLSLDIRFGRSDGMRVLSCGIAA